MKYKNKLFFKKKLNKILKEEEKEENKASEYNKEKLTRQLKKIVKYNNTETNNNLKPIDTTILIKNEKKALQFKD